MTRATSSRGCCEGTAAVEFQLYYERIYGVCGDVVPFGFDVNKFADENTQQIGGHDGRRGVDVSQPRVTPATKHHEQLQHAVT